MAKWKPGQLTAFGKFLETKEISRLEAAGALGVTRQYISLMALHLRPAYDLMIAIEAYAKKRGGSVPLASWEGVPGFTEMMQRKAGKKPTR